MSATATLEAVEMYVHANADEAFVSACGELTNPAATERAETGQYGYSYANLPGVLDSVRPTFARHGLAIMQPVQTVDELLSVETIVMHTSGTTVTSGRLLVRMPPNPQQTGSTITYQRRYQLCALVGIAADEDDDDGRKASTATTPRKRTTTTRRDPSETPPAQTRPVAQITDAQRRHIMAMFNALGLNGEPNRNARLAYTSNAIGREIDTTTDITRDEARVLIEALIADTQIDDERDEPGY